jgi:multisite-specific tRNA:(cytosine-C5)-methyltransferase
MIANFEDTSATSTGKKRKKNSNPLSLVRGKQQRPENVWFRRSNAGYALFVEYYAGQPNGTICDYGDEQEAEEKDDAHALTILKEEPSGRVPSKSIGGAGMSRAAKKRNKKKRKNNPSSESQQQEAEQDEETKNSDQTQQQEEFKGPLSLALTKLLAQDSTPGSTASTAFRSFLRAMARPLPLTFRVRQSLSKREMKEVHKYLSSNEDYGHLVGVVPFDKDIYQALPSPSKNNITTVTLTKQNLARTAPSLKTDLVESSQDGSLGRQDLGSMLPVLALAKAGYIKKGSRIVDMCASPGSKTLQALELIGVGGRIVANDVSEARLEILKAAVQRSGMTDELFARITYTCQDATRLKVPQFRTKGGTSATPNLLGWNVALCDVPCSGDGTCRKDRHILPMWKPTIGNGLHSTQLKILVRALEVVEPGGMVCYSTCSLNPVENEAVVAEAIRKMMKKQAKKDDSSSDSSSSPCVELVEWPEADLPGFIRRSGISEWRVADYEDSTTAANAVVDEDDENEEETPCLRWYDTWEDAQNANNMLEPLNSMWPTGTTDTPSDLHLERCTRLWPQDQDTGGFFLALLRKNF